MFYVPRVYDLDDEPDLNVDTFKTLREAKHFLKDLEYRPVRGDQLRWIRGDKDCPSAIAVIIKK